MDVDLGMVVMVVRRESESRVWWFMMVVLEFDFGDFVGGNGVLICCFVLGLYFEYYGDVFVS